MPTVTEPLYVSSLRQKVLKYRLGALGAAGLLVGPGQILDRERPRPDVLWREGHEFSSQAEAANATPEEMRVRVPRWVWLVMETLREMRLTDATGHLADGKPLGEQAAWKVELWEAFWSGRGRAQAAQERERSW